MDECKGIVKLKLLSKGDIWLNEAKVRGSICLVLHQSRFPEFFLFDRSICNPVGTSVALVATDDPLRVCGISW